MVGSYKAALSTQFCSVFFELHIPLRMDCLKIAVPKQKTLSPSKLPDTVGSKCLIFRQLHYHMFSVNPNVTIVLLNIATFAASQQNSPCFNKQGLVWLWYHILMSHVSDLLLDSEKMRDSLTLSIIYPIENISYIPFFHVFPHFLGCLSPCWLSSRCFLSGWKCSALSESSSSLHNMLKALVRLGICARLGWLGVFWSNENWGLMGKSTINGGWQDNDKITTAIVTVMLFGWCIEV